jgi:putative ABC transport system ATP-binding protein
MDRSPILQVELVSKSFLSGKAPLTVLYEISFTLLPEATCAIVGPSGSGKSTLLGLCAGLDLPDTGSIILDGQNLGSLSEDARAWLRSERVGFVFQNFQLIPTLTALENVMVPLELRGQKEVRSRAAALLEKVGLGDRLTHYPVQLSGGEQQRVALARAFINQPRILFADEPTGNLDAETGHTIVETLFEMNRAYATTLVLVTHDLELAGRANRIIQLKGGRILPPDAPQPARSS